MTVCARGPRFRKRPKSSKIIGIELGAASSTSRSVRTAGTLATEPTAALTATAPPKECPTIASNGPNHVSAAATAATAFAMLSRRPDEAPCPGRSSAMTRTPAARKPSTIARMCSVRERQPCTTRTVRDQRPESGRNSCAATQSLPTGSRWWRASSMNPAAASMARLSPAEGFAGSAVRQKSSKAMRPAMRGAIWSAARNIPRMTVNPNDAIVALHRNRSSMNIIVQS